MADDTPNQAPPSGKLKWIIFAAVGALLLVAGAVGATLYIVGGSGGAETAAEPEPLESRTPYYVELLDPKFAVNLATGSRAKFLKISLTALTFDPDVDTALRDHMPQVRSNLMLLLSAQQSQQLAERSGREALQKLALDKVQQTLAQVGVEGAVETIYFTHFVMQ